MLCQDSNSWKNCVEMKQFGFFLHNAHNSSTTAAAAERGCSAQRRFIFRRRRRCCQCSLTRIHTYTHTHIHAHTHTPTHHDRRWLCSSFGTQTLTHTHTFLLTLSLFLFLSHSLSLSHSLTLSLSIEHTCVAASWATLIFDDIERRIAMTLTENDAEKKTFLSCCDVSYMLQRHSVWRRVNVKTASSLEFDLTWIFILKKWICKNEDSDTHKDLI